MNSVFNQAIYLLIITIFSAALSPCQAYSEQRRVPLKEFQAHPGPIRLNGASAHHDMFIPVYEKTMLESIELNLQYTNSISLIPGISQISVLVDGFTVAQIGLSPLRPQGKSRVNIPVELLNSENMRLTLRADQHYDRECETPGSGQLWTEINPVKSELIFNYSAMPERPTIRHWITMFSPANPFLSKAAIVVPETGATWLEAASSISAWLAVIRDYRPLDFKVSLEIVPGIPNIIIGPRSFIRETLDKAVKPLQDAETGKTVRISLPDDITGPYAGTVVVPRLAGNPTRCLVVTGTKVSDAVSAAHILAIVTENWPENNWLALNSDTDHMPPPYRRDCLQPDTSYAFSRLGLYGNMVFQGMGALEQAISLYIPPEMFRQENRYAKFDLDIIYSSGLREDSTLLIMINNTLAGSIPLNNPDGKTFADYMVQIPMSFFSAGHNTVSFRAIMKPFRAAKCAPVGPEGMVTALLASSEVTIPSGHEHYTLPDLAMIMDDMFPYSLAVEKGEKPALIIPDPRNRHNFEAAVNFTAMFAKRLKSPLSDLFITDQISKDFRGDVIYIGTLDSLPDDIKKVLPLFGSLNSLKYLLPWKKEAVLNIRNNITDSRLLVTQFEYPDSSTRTALVITAMKPETVSSGIKLLESHATAKLSGDTALMDTKTRELKTYSIHRQFQVGKLGLQEKTGNWLTSRPEYYYPLLAIVVLILGLLALLLAKRRKKIRNEEE